MAHPLVVWVGLEVGAVLDVVKVLDFVLGGHVPEAAAGVCVGGGPCNSRPRRIVPYLTSLGVAAAAERVVGK